MSRPVHRIAPKVLSLLHERRMTCASLGRLAGLSERHVIRTLANHPQAHAKARSRLIPHLTAGELAHLGWAYAADHTHGGAVFHAAIDAQVPQETRQTG